MDGLRPRRAHVGRGLVQRATAGSRSTRRRGAGRSAGRTRARRRVRRERRGAGARRIAPSAARAPALHARHVSAGRRSRRQRSGRRRHTDRPALAPRRPARAEWHSRPRPPGRRARRALFVLVKLGVRRSRYLTHDPRRIAAACRRELVDFLRGPADRRSARASAPRELGGAARHAGSGVDASGFADALGRARYGPLSRARGPPARRGASCRAVRRGLRRALPPGRRLRGAFSVRSLFARVVERDRDGRGEGRRLRPITERWPKPILPIDGRAVIATLLRQLQAEGTRAVTVVTGHLAEQVEELLDGLDVAFRAPARAGRLRRRGSAGPGRRREPAGNRQRRGHRLSSRRPGAGRRQRGAGGRGRVPRRIRATDPDRVDGGLVTRVVADEPSLPLASAPLWLLTGRSTSPACRGRPTSCPRRFSARSTRVSVSQRSRSGQHARPDRPNRLGPRRTFPTLRAR